MLLHVAEKRNIASVVTKSVIDLIGWSKIEQNNTKGTGFFLLLFLIWPHVLRALNMSIISMIYIHGWGGHINCKGRLLGPRAFSVPASSSSAPDPELSILCPLLCLCFFLLSGDIAREKVLEEERVALQPA